MTETTAGFCLGPLTVRLTARSEWVEQLPESWFRTLETDDDAMCVRIGQKNRADEPPFALPIRKTPDGFRIATRFVEGGYCHTTNSWELDVLQEDGVGADTPRKLRSALRLLCLWWLSEHDGLALHGASAVIAGKAVGFLGKSGVGKSTLVRKHSFVLGDDFLAVVRRNNQLWAFGTPFSGREGLSTRPGQFPIRSLTELSRGPSTSVSRLSLAQAVHAVANHTFLADSSANARTTTLELVTWTAQVVPVYALSVALTNEPWDLAELRDG